MGIKNKSQPGVTPEQLVKAAKECLNTEKYKAGIEYCNQALKIDKRCAEAYCVRGALRNVANDFDASIADLVKSIELEPTPLAYSLLGDTWCEKHDFAEAVRNYNKALEFDPDDIGTINDRAEAYFHMDDYDNAIQDYERLNILKPEEPNPYYNCGVCHRRKGNVPKAIEYFDKSIERGKQDANVYNSRGNAYMDMGEYDKAIADFNRLEELGDDFAPLYARAAMKKQEAQQEVSGGSDIKKSQEKILDIDTILDREELLQKQCKANNENYNEWLIGKFISFVQGKEVLDAFIRTVAKVLDLGANYILLEFTGLIVSCFELPMFKIKKTSNDKDGEMLEYIKDFVHQNLFMIEELNQAQFFADDRNKKEFEDWVNENNLQMEVKEEHDDVSVVLARYPSSQPYLRERIASLVFSPGIEIPMKSKRILVAHFHLIIEFLSKYYFE
jgi:tetratricopeptide (TPR) repeat protein